MRCALGGGCRRHQFPRPRLGKTGSLRTGCTQSKEPALRIPAPLPCRALDGLHGTVLGAPLPGLCHARQPGRSWCGADLVAIRSCGLKMRSGNFRNFARTSKMQNLPPANAAPSPRREDYGASIEAKRCWSVTPPAASTPSREKVFASLFAKRPCSAIVWRTGISLAIKRAIARCSGVQR